MTSTATLNSLFAPRSIAVVGASNTPGKSGATPIALLRKQGYAGRIHPVNPKEHEVQGLPCFPTIGDIDGDVDLAIIAVPARFARGALEAARPGQLGNAVIFTSGFAEVDEAGRAEQKALQALAGQRGIRLLGPNCLGFMNIPQNVYATFSPAPLTGIVPAGKIGMVTQSGAFGAYAYSMARERGIGLSFWVSTGNESDVDVADCMQWLVQDPNTEVIMAYMEGCQDGEALKRALRAAHEAGKPVVVTKIGRTAAGAQAAASHTAALAGNDAVYDALFRQYGAYRAHSMDEFFTLGQALSIWKGGRARRSLGIVTISGGVGALMADEADDQGLALPPLPEDLRRRLLARIPFAGPANPVDVTGQAITDPAVFQDTCLDMLETGAYGALAVFLAAAGSSESLWPHIEQLARSLQARHPETPLAICALLPAERRRKLEELGCMVFSDPSDAVRTLGATLGRHVALPARPDGSQADSFAVEPGAGAFSESASLQILARAGIPVVPSIVATSAAQACAHAKALGAPAAMKIVSADIPHKSDIGGVRLNVQGDDAVAQAYQALRDAAKKHAPAAKVDGVLVAPMISDGVECIMGVHGDPVFGPVVMFGLGGVFVEILKDVTFRLAPFDAEEAKAMILSTRASEILQGARGKPAADIDALAQALAALSRLAYAARDTISSIDVNPIVARPAGLGAMALDAVVVRKA
ncbi:MAG: acetate--CoA ligase family protein [Alcaligenaceae bacterium]|nr:acetate--CoA ligase family protein [Alcaligenaceae bacterium]